jgi:IrrE N-terminal-like domain
MAEPIDRETRAARRTLERFAATYPLEDRSTATPVEDIADSLCGLHVVEVEDLGVSGMLVPARREILVDAGECREAPGRRRFTVAHEVGHWLLHATAPEAAPVFCRHSEVQEQAERPSDPVEREANRFAAELLMPEPVVRDLAARDAGCRALAEEMGVSEIAMGWRLFNLGLTAERPAAER